MGTIIQILVNSIISGLILSLVAVGFAYIFRVTKVFHLAHGGIYSAGAFSCWWLFSKTHNWLASIVFAILTVSILIYIIEKTIYLPLNRKQSNQSISLIASMGLYVVIINTLALLFGNENKILDNSISGSYELSIIIFTKIQLIQTFFGIATIALLVFYLKKSKSKLVLQ